MSGEGTLLGLMLWFKFSVETFVRLGQKNCLVAQNSECYLEWVKSHTLPTVFKDGRLQAQPWNL